MAKLKRPRTETDIPSASMADIAFLLLVFFIATTVFNIEEGLTLILPPKGQQIQRQVSRKNVLVVRSDANSNVYADDIRIGDVGSLSDLVKQRLSQNDKLVVSIESHPDSEYRVMIKILDEVKEAEAPRISIKSSGAAAGEG